MAQTEWKDRRLVVRPLNYPDTILVMDVEGYWTVEQGFMPPGVPDPGGQFVPDPIGDVLRNADFMRQVEVLEKPDPLPPEAFDIPEGAIP